jgi:hypothetical protein
MLSSNVPHVKDVYFQHPVLTKIHGKPVYESVRLLADEVKANAANVPTTLGGGEYGHLGLVLSDQRYAALPNSLPWVTPVNPGIFAPPAGATGPQIEAARDVWRQRLRTYELFQATEKALIAQVVEAIDTIYLRAKWNRATGQYTGSISAILLHLFTTYGKITPMDVQVKEQAVSNMAYAIMQPVDVVFDAIEDLADLAETGLSPIPSQKMVDMAYLLLAKEPLFRQDLLQWNRRPTAEKTWANMMEHFRDAQTDMNSLPTAGDVYHQHHGNANSVIAIADLVAQRLLDAANAADASAPPDAVLPTANAVIADREASLLQREAALLTQMQAMMATFNPSRNNRTTRNRGPRNDRVPAAAPAAANAPNNRSARTPPARAYCWTHGLCAHASSQCNSRLVGHQVTATFADMQGGSTNNCFWIQN